MNSRVPPSPLEGPNLRVRADRLPRSVPPSWMRWLFVGGAAFASTVATITLLGPLDEMVQVGGEVRPAEYRLVYPLSEGVVAELAAQIGSRVEPGAPLARIDGWTVERERERTAAELTQATADAATSDAALRRTRAAPILSEFLFNGMVVDQERKLVQLQREVLGRLDDLHRQGGASDLQVLTQRQQVVSAELTLARHEQAAATLAGGLGEANVAEAAAAAAAAHARIEALRQRVVILDRELERLRITAPVAGTVIAASVRFAGERVRLGEPVFKIAVGEGIMLRLAASEDRLGEIRPGQVVRFRPKSDPDRLSPMATGRVVEVALDRDLDKEEGSLAGNRTYRILVQPDSATRAIPFGAQVDAEIVLRQRPFWRLLMLKK